ncbi:MAG: hypothetical protein ABI434_21375, partial [Burkholderiaceae bacterium]
MTEPQQPKEDALVRMYAQASAQDPRRPAPRVADAIRTHARVVIAAGDAAAAPKPAARRDAMEAVNHPRWKTSLLASIAVIGLAGMLFLQFDRGAPQQQDLARGPHAPDAPVPMQSKDQVAQRSVLPREEPVAPSASVPVAAP